MRSRTGSGRPADRGHLRRRRSALPRVIERAEVRADAASRIRGAGRPATPVRALLHRRGPAPRAGPGRRRPAGAGTAHRRRRPARHGPGAVDQLRRPPPRPQRRPLVGPGRGPPPAPRARRRPRPRRPGGGRHRRHRRAPPGRQDRGARHLPRPGASSRGHFVKASGPRWLCLMVMAPMPWGGVWGLPFLTVLAPSERYAHARGQRHKRLTDRARQALLRTARWLPGRRVVAVADSSFSAIDLLRAIARRLCMVTRLRLDAALYEPAPAREPRTVGRPRVKGARLPSLAERIGDPATPWRRVTIAGWYGGGERRLDVASGTAVWHHPGMRVPIRWVLVRDAEGEREPQAFLCTDLEADPITILGWFVRRWRCETTFEEARRHLGMETQRQWSELAILRTTPALLGLFSLVAVWAAEIRARRGLPLDAAYWYPKRAPTFSDALAAVRAELWRAEAFTPSRSDPEGTKIPAGLLDRLLLVACRPP